MYHPSPIFRLYCTLHAVWGQGGDGEVGHSGDKAKPNFVSASLPTITAWLSFFLSARGSFAMES